jgi:hypothetical protein
VTSEQQARDVEKALRGEDVCRYCDRVMPIEHLELCDAAREKAYWIKGGESLVLMCDVCHLQECIDTRRALDQRAAGQ